MVLLTLIVQAPQNLVADMAKQGIEAEDMVVVMVVDTGNARMAEEEVMGMVIQGPPPGWSGGPPPGPPDGPPDGPPSGPPGEDGDGGGDPHYPYARPDSQPRSGRQQNRGMFLRYNDGLPKNFDGSGKVEAKAYLRSLEDYFLLHEITDDATKINRMKITLENHARLWLDEQMEQNTYNDLKVEFLKQFTGTITFDSNIHKFRGCTWREDRPLEQYRQQLIMFAEIIGCAREKDGSYSRELKTQFKMGLPGPYQMALSDLTEDDSLDTIMKRTQKHWDIIKLNKLQAAQVTLADTSVGVTMKATADEAQAPLTIWTN